MFLSKYLYANTLYVNLRPPNHRLSKTISTAKRTEWTPEKNSVPDIPDFYRSKSVFITGGTGFMGKVLVERLLSTCPDIGNLYLLMRDKRGVSYDRRVQQLKGSQLFDVLRRNHPRQLDKIVGVRGDSSVNQFGLSKADRQQLDQVSVVFHMAASVRLEEPLGASVTNNLRPTIEMLQLCDQLPKIDAFIYVSTCYCNAERSRVDEKVYPPPMDLDAFLAAVDGQELTMGQTKKLIGAKPNTYTFTKAMAEHAIDRHACKGYPAAIFRPAIVISTIRDPFPGWIENFNGPSAVIAGASTGLLRVFSLQRTARADLMPVDLSIDALIAAAWEIAVDKPKKVRVYNCANSENPTTWGRYVDAVNEHTVRYPSKNVVWWPHLHVTSNRFLYKPLELIMQTIPTTVIGFIAKLLGSKSRKYLIGSVEHNRIMNEPLKYFSTHEWVFVNDKLKELRRRLSENDKAVFNLDPNTINWNEQLKNLVKGTRRYVMKETDDSLDRARMRVRRFGLIITATKGAFVLVGLNTLYFYLMFV